MDIAPDNNLAIIETTDITSETPPDVCAELLTKMEFLKARVRDMEKLLKEKLVNWCLETGQDIVITEGVRYYAGDEKETLCADTRATLEALFQSCDGDFDKVAACLASRAWKPGACRETLPADLFGELFTTKVKVVLKEGKPQKQLLKFDERFAK